jgi:hypothetical protein
MACKDGGGGASPFNRRGRILKRGEGRCKIKADYEISAGSALASGVPSPTPLAATVWDGSGGSQADLHGRPAVHRPVVAATGEGECGGNRFNVGSRVSIGREERICFWAWRWRAPFGGVAWLPLSIAPVLWLVAVILFPSCRIGAHINGHQFIQSPSSYH